MGSTAELTLGVGGAGKLAPGCEHGELAPPLVWHCEKRRDVPSPLAIYSRQEIWLLPLQERPCLSSIAALRRTGPALYLGSTVEPILNAEASGELVPRMEVWESQLYLLSAGRWHSYERERERPRQREKERSSSSPSSLAIHGRREYWPWVPENGRTGLVPYQLQHW